jgi:glucose/arabinose dehydrogenase
VTRRTTGVVVGLALVAVAAAGCGQGGNRSDVDVMSSSPAASPTTALDGVPNVVGTLATGLDVPWGIDFLPDGRAVVTERTGRVLLVTPPPKSTVTEIGRIPGVVARGESGLLGVAVSPTFATDATLYLYVCTADDNRVVRARLDGDRLGAPEPILTGIPTGQRHDGGRLAFGPDGFLYVSTGETGDAQLARDRDSLAGKILRITADGKPAPDNPFGTPVWSWGHRNVEGLAFDPQGSLWASEFGDSKADELNRILPGEDYGWPVVEGRGGPRQYTQPELTWPPDEASPSGLAYAGGYLWMGALRGERLWRIKVVDGQASDPTPYFEGDYGRLRTVVRAPDGRLWLTTSNRDGRGKPGAEDDRILLIEP